jgi:membrane associated rhomboid family serine protease
VIPLRDANPGRRRPLLTGALVAACLAVFGWELALGSIGGEGDLEAFVRSVGVVPAQLTGAAPPGPGLPPAATLLTYVFVHAGWLHLAGNMLYLWIFGNNVEERLGRPGFVLTFAAGGAFAALAHVAIDPASELPLIGASGAISTVLGVYLVLWPRARVVALVFLGIVYQLMEVPALVLLGFWFVLQLLDGVLSLGAETGGGVAVFAHIGGFVFGVAIGGAARWLRPTRRAAA